MFKPIDTLLNTITMYRLVLYGLVVTALFSLGAAAVGFLSFSLVSLGSSLILILFTCFVSNFLFSKAFKAPVNTESQFITAFILFLLLAPPQTLVEYIVVASASVLAMGSKYLIAIQRKHIANPVAVALLLLGLWGRGEGIWWVGSVALVPVAFIFSVLVLRKMRRFALAFSFLCAALVVKTAFGLSDGISLLELYRDFFLSGPVFFFVGIMLTEPLTTPPTKKLQMVYGMVVGLLYGAQFSFGPLYASPELALVLGNVFSYIVSPKYRLKLFLKEKRELAANLCEFVFTTTEKVHFRPGQYFEWTLPHANADMRGMRRYFTIASSPTEQDIHLGVRMESGRSSSFKTALSHLEVGATVMASSLAGDFILPKDTKEKLVFIAGGIGVTPFRSMVKYLKDIQETRDIVFFYANRTEQEIAYRELFEEAREVGVRMVYVANEVTSTNWHGYTGFLTKEILAKEVGDMTERTFYISGSHGMVTAFEKILKESGVPSGKIHTDFFPGFA